MLASVAVFLGAVFAKVAVGLKVKQHETGSTVKQDVVLYDGHCRFCTRQIETLRRLDGKNRLRFLSLHDPSVATDYPDLSFDQLSFDQFLYCFLLEFPILAGDFEGVLD